MNRVSQLFQSSVLVIAFFGLSKITGLFRQRQIALTFGTSGEMDAFNAANQLPELFFVLIAGGALAAAFIPVYTNYVTGERIKEALRLTHSTMTVVIAVLSVIAGVSALFAPVIAPLLTPDFPVERQQLVAEIMRIILFQTFLFGISGVLTAYLQANQHFALPALASVALDIGYMVGIWLFVPTMGIYGLAWGTVVGAVLHILIQAPALVRHRFTYRPLLDFSQSGFQEILRLMGPRIMTLGTIQFADLILGRLLSGLPEGSTSGYFYGYSLMQLPETLFATAIAIVIFPTMAELYNQNQIQEMKKLATNTLGIIWTLTIPSAVGLIALGQPLIRVLFEGEAFTAQSTALVYATLIFFSLRVVSEGTLEIVARLFYAQHDMITPMFSYFIWLVVQWVLARWLVGPLGGGGLALSSTLAFTVLSIILFVLNQRRLGSLGEFGLWKTAGRAVVAAGGMALVMVGLAQFVDGALLQLAAGLVVGGVTYLGLVILLGGREIQAIINLVRARFVSDQNAL
ncbi:MAG: murein biosynthesis integral membrane protein MurJ [Ardenticatenaceae bacterium]|nr:murein biosynthesis integral membrane protein MurJ [Ardenticatenaceae bacterium]